MSGTTENPPSQQRPAVRCLRRRRDLHRLVGATAVVALAAVACGDADEAGGPTSDRPTATSGVSVPPTAPPGADPTTSITTPVTTTTTTTTTAPASTGPGTTTSTSTATTTTAGGSTTTTTERTAVPVGLADWPAPPTPAGLDDVPFLLPGEPIEGVATGLREETTRDPGDFRPVSGDHVQFWVSDDGTSQLTIRTHLDGEPTGSDEFRVPVDVEPWDSAFTFEDSGAFTGITLVDERGFVAVESYGIDQAVVTELARSIERRPVGRPGWRLGAGAPELVAVHEGWSSHAIGTASREIDWFDSGRQLEAELSISVGQPGRFAQIWRPRSAVGIVDVGGSRAMTVRYGDGSDAPTIVAWSPGEDQIIQFGVTADQDRALEIARGIGPVTEQAWNSVARPPDAPRDGCTTFIC